MHRFQLEHPPPDEAIARIKASIDNERAAAVIERNFRSTPPRQSALSPCRPR
jgi:hypothetical protein